MIAEDANTLDTRPPTSNAARFRLLDLLPVDVRALVEATAETRVYEFGDVVVREGEAAHGLYSVVSGRARVVIDDGTGEELPVATLGSGESFGVAAVLDGGIRTATVRARDRLVCHRLDGSVLRGLAATDDDVQKAVELDQKRTELNDLFAAFPSFLDLAPDHMRMLLEEVRILRVPRGERVITAGDPVGPMYVVKHGKLTSSRDGNLTTFLRSGDVFGERSVLLGEPRGADVDAVDDCVLVEMNPDLFSNVLRADPEVATQLTRQAEEYLYKSIARVPVDFAEELLPAQAFGGEQRRKTSAGGGRPDTLAGADSAAMTANGPRPFADGDSFVKDHSERIRRFKHRFQVDEADCGPACISMISAYHGKRIGLSQAREAAGTDVSGSSLAGLVRAGQALGLRSRSVKASPTNLDHLPLPAIAHWEGNHWVVILDITDSAVRIADPAVGKRKVSRQQFLESWSGFAALFEPGANFETSSGTRSRLAWAKPFLRQLQRPLLLALMLSVISSAGAMVIPLFTQTVVDRVLIDGDQSFLTVVLVGLSGTVVVLGAVNIAQGLVLAHAAVDLDRSTLGYLSHRLLRLPMSYFQARRTGDIQHRLDGLRQLRQFVVGNVLETTTSILRLAFSLFLMLRFSYVLSATWLLTMPVYVLMMRFAAERMRPRFDLLDETHGRYSSRQIDAIKGIETVKVSAAEESLERRLDEEFELLTSHQLATDRAQMGYNAVLEVIQTASLGLFLYVGATQVIDGHLTLGEFVSFNSFVALATGPIMYLIGLWDNVQSAGVTLARLEDIFDAEPEQGDDHTHLRAVPSIGGAVSLDHVSFSYAPGAPNVIEDVSIDVPPGTTVALVGRSGSGKSTLAKLLAGLVEPTSGQVRYDGVDIRELDYRDLRRHIGIVLQDTHVFNDTIAENICLGDPSVDDDQLQEAARIAAAHAFIKRLPLGYETVIGESGLRLSGGQLQRVAIARAVYSRPTVLLLDEATSALDVESERAVQENMAALLDGRTAFVIAHRLSTIRHADLIVVVDEGRIVEVGDHDDLMARQGIYFYLTSQQLHG